ncbi:MAG: PAS domain S-box protein [Clostridiales bacterium]|nr:PAS domain S-box protein [Clostridiales bacterium]
MTKRIFRTILLVSALVLVCGLACVMGVLYSYFSRQLKEELHDKAAYLAVAVEGDGAAALEKLSGRPERITMVAADGTVLYDNRADESTMTNHADREEIQEALKTGSGEAVRQSDTLAEQTVYYALRLNDGSVLRVSSTQYNVPILLVGLLQPLAFIILLLLALSGFFAFRASKKIVEPINQLDLEHPEEGESYEEIAPLLTKIHKQQKTIAVQLAEAKRQQAAFAQITADMEEGLLVIDEHGALLSVNPSALRLLEVKDVQPSENVLTLNRSEPFRRAVETALDGRHEAAVLTFGEMSCQVTANPVWHDGKPSGAVLLLVDITEKLQRETLRREFTANVSHELKTPLTSISGFAEILRDGMVQGADVEKFAGRIFDEAQRLITLVSDVIKISQLDEGQLPYVRETVELQELVRTMFDRLHHAADKAGVTLTLEGEPAALSTVRPILEEVLFNLCDNAIKYNRRGGRVTVHTGRQDDRVVLAVSDTGIGIPPAHQQRIFERFYRVDKSHSKEIGGTGLGLSIVKHGAAYLGAAVTVESEPGNGSTFTLTWPE